MKVILRVCVFLALFTPVFAWSAQQTGMTANQSFRAGYDVSREITVTGNVSGVSFNSKAPSGAHVLITTTHGSIDAHLGNFALQGSQPLSLQRGQAVRVVGMMTRINGSQVLLARTVSNGTKTYIIRNEHGALLFPQPAGRGRVRFKIVSRGGVPQ